MGVIKGAFFKFIYSKYMYLVVISHYITGELSCDFPLGVEDFPEDLGSEV